jgi:hypothetical protein
LPRTRIHQLSPVVDRETRSGQQHSDEMYDLTLHLRREGADADVVAYASMSDSRIGQMVVDSRSRAVAFALTRVRHYDRIKYVATGGSPGHPFRDNRTLHASEGGSSTIAGR